MKRIKLLVITLCITPLLLVGCEYDIPTQPDDETSPIPEGRQEMFRNFLVVGGSLTSGIMDGAFYKQGQRGAYANLLGAHLDSVLQQNAYGIPATENEQGVNLAPSQSGSSKGRFSLSFRSFDSDYPARLSSEGQSLDEFQGSLENVHNFSIPNLRSYHLQNPDSLQQNPFYQRLGIQGSGQDLLDLVISRTPSLVLLSLGTDDAYSYILNGASGRLDPPNDEIRWNDATPLSLFEQSVQDAVDRLLANTESDIILPTIIDPTDFFFFTTLRWHYTIPEIGNHVLVAADHYSQTFNPLVVEYNQDATFENRRPVITFDTENTRKARAKVFVDDLLPDAEVDGTVIPKWRQMTPDDEMLYSAEIMQFNSFNNGDKKFATTEPAADKYVLSGQELEMVQTLLDSYNDVLRSIANSSDRVLLLDLHNYMQDVEQGTETFQGVTFRTDFDQNSIISADGYFPNHKGHALLANQLLQLLNNAYDTRFKNFEVNNFPGNEYDLDF